MKISGSRALAVAGAATLLAGCGGTDTPTAGPGTAPSSTVTRQTSPPGTPTGTPPPPSQSPGTPSTPPTGCVDQKLRQLTPREQAAQLIMTGISTNGMTSAEQAIADAQKPGGLLLMGPGGSADHTRTAMAKASTTATVKGIRPFVAADQEGGKIQRLKGPGFDRIPAATVQATWSGDKLTARAKTWGGQLKQAGVNMDLAPVADVVPASLGDDNAPIGALDRGYGNTPEKVSPQVTAFVKGMNAAGVMTSVKHFPGLGRVKGNTDFSSGVVDTVTTRDDDDLAPFEAGIKAGSELVMVSTVTYTKIDPKNRAVFSPTIIGGMLRGDLGYAGVVITDDVGAAAEVASVPAGQRATRFVAAGGDIVITAKASLTSTMVEALVAKAQQDKQFAAAVQASVRRVLMLKQNRGLLSCG
ncbi:glycoside hydrolase family 3 N-terminal domain-containing protein [Kribbella sp. CA-293567]|uniref:glycoside hydrolase family 3 N-terminal domain-containing protein n=1 Tax=Kribbella sp. CA-293567 TaxID=3002436 RepID=UPI0022DD9002|nr:glycoside hydrolase family 3 N-terminal domain-containing protein [Kribbella sp. CA-293567]WBQ04629.1 glycoside hydrolase family 3 [Kribbella sp. CA-293567]